ncbi:MAG TPA: fused MFS/spermidine synthase [Gemmataceae bacterium]|nr:fused MFS/spermidine synthase [Gemmataceae bacterium]
MAKQHRPSLPVTPYYLPLLLVLFVGSGCSALIYEIVWFQLLQLVLGSTAVSLAVLLGTFMGGMCLGSLALPRYISVQHHPLRVYAFLELGIGLIGLAVLFGVPHADQLYAASAGHGFWGIMLRAVFSAVCLLPPTLLMGGTLPAIARWVEMTPQSVSWLGFFYGANIVGAVFGCLLAGFYLLRVHDVATATYVAVALNGAVALIGLGLANITSYQASSAGAGAGNRGPTVKPADSALPRVGDGMVYVTIALSGLCALAAEVIWTRLLSLMLGGTVYTFSIILAVFLTGLGIGSSIGSFLARTTARPRLLLGSCQLLLALAIAWTASLMARSLPYWPINPSLSTSPWFTFQVDLTRCAWAVLPATVLWGASFPLALAALAVPGQDSGRLVGSVYAANTVGAILGALGASLLLIAWLGTQQSQRILIGLSTAAALLMFLPYCWPFQADASSGSPNKLARRVAGTVGIVASISLATLLARTIPQIPWELIGYGRYLTTRLGEAEMLYMGEGMNSSVAVSQMTNSTRNFHVSGKIEASTEPQDMRLQRMLGHLPALFHPRPRSVLIVGCGAGVTAGSFVTHPDIERIVICEIEPLIPRVVARYFAKENYDIVTGIDQENPHTVNGKQVEVVYDDARHYVLTTKETFDIITSDPIHPYVKGAASLYTKDYFEWCKKRLNPGGLVTQWVPLYESDHATVKSEIATFFDAFPNGTIWGNDIDGTGYDLVLLGQSQPLKINVEELQQRLSREDHAEVLQSLKDVGFRGLMDLLATYAGQGPDLKPWLKDAEINRDRNLRLQYLAGMGANLKKEAVIFDEIVSYRKFPDDLFVLSDQNRMLLKVLLRRRPVDQ